MGWLDKLVKPAIKQGDKMEYVDPEQVGEALAKAAAATAQPSTADVQGSISEPYMAQGETMSPGPMSTPQPDAPEMVQPPDQTTTSYSTPPAAPQPSIVHPSLEQASTDANGLPAASTPGLTRLGKLFQILGLAAKGGLAGRAASERAVAESGGHRGGGFGGGFEAGLTEAPREATMQQGVERGAMENATAKANLSALPWLRAMQQQKAVADLEEAKGKAKTSTLVNGRNGIYDAGTGKVLPGTGAPDKQMNQSPQQVYADAVKDAMDRGLNGDAILQDPKVQGALGALHAAALDKPDTATQLKQHQAAIVSKLDAAGELLPGSLTDVNKLQQSIKASKSLSPQEKSDSTGYLATNTTPPAQGTNVIIRSDEFAKTRGLNAVLDKQTGETRPMSWFDYNRLSQADPNRYASPQWDAELKGDMAAATAVGRDMPLQVRSFGQFLGHAADLSKAVEELRNTKSPWLNYPINKLRQNAAGSVPITNFLAKVDPVRKEFESFLINNRALTVDDRQKGQEILGENQNPAAMQSAIRSFMHTALVRLNELNQSYYTQTGRDYPGLVSPQGAKVLEDFGYGAEAKAFRARGMVGGTTSKRGTNQPAENAPAKQSTEGNYAPGFSPL